MKDLCFIIVLILAAHSLCGQASFSVEMQNYYSKFSNVSASGFLWAFKSFEGKNYGVYAYALAGNGYGEVHIGRSQTFPSRRPGKFIQIGTSIGLETGPHPLRGGAYFFFKANPDETEKSIRRQWQGAIAAEIGSIGFWYSGFINYNVSNRVGIGVLAQALDGVWGPRLEYSKGGILIYVAGGYGIENEELGAVSGLRCYF